ncbi:iron ABC transporter permease, partial [Mycobacterium sp. PS03-16]|uniref:ABC transporter permease n=1 Tax=Mycobacterium sp. PS03-16 TaxID=2559611 RepID=UPI001FD73773
MAPHSRPDHRPRATRPGPVISVTVAALLAATFIPLGYVAWSVASVGPTRAVELIVRARVAELLVNTVALVLITVPVCLALGIGAAWLTERTDLIGRSVLRPLFVAPLAVPAFVNSYAWVSVVPSLHGLGAGVLVATLSYFPFVYVPAAATLRRLDPAIEESARSLGSGSAAVFFRVVVPQLRLAILGGGLLIAVHLLAEYGAFAMLRFATFTTAIFEQFQSTFDGAAGSTLAAVLVLLCLLLLLAEAAARGKARYARVGSGAQRAITPIRLGKNTLPAQAALAGLAVLALGVPSATIVRWLWIGGAQVWALDDL